jgi:hypothetical protein
MSRLQYVLMKCLLLLALLSALTLCAEPQPGDVFQEFTYGWRFGEVDLGSKREGIDNMRKNSRQEHAIELPRLASVTGAEVSIEYWGGHIGTSEQKFQVNGGDWIDIPQPQGTPTNPQCYHRTILGRATVTIPVTSLQQGRNVFRFHAGPQVCYGFDWGFYWVYSFTVRLYSKPGEETAGRIVSPAEGDEIGDNPRLVVEAGKKDKPISSVEFIGKYEDFNWEGDGVFRQWHYITMRGQLRLHIGTVTSAPYAVTWNTSWVPDQTEPVELTARITDAYGNVYLTPGVKVHFRRKGRSVRMYKALDVPEVFAVRVGRKKECKFQVADDLSRARAARIVLSTWSAAHGDEIGLNGTKLVDRVGLVHNYSFDSIPVPLRNIKPGDNVFYIFSNTKEHALEVNWPGPVLLVEYGEDKRKPASAAKWLDPSFPHRVAVEVSAGGVERFDAVAETELALQGGTRVVELGSDAEVKDTAVPVQVDPGSVALLLKGRTGPNETRRYHVYFGGTQSPKPPARVTVLDDGDCAGQKSFRIKTSSATYCYQKEGAGFASLVDTAGNEWIGYRPGGRSAGEFRGIPNLGKEFGHPGYQGATGAASRLVSAGPLRATIISERIGGNWAAKWEIFPTHARMTLLRADKPYWFLYEGTPGGKLDLAAGFQVTSDGMRRNLAQIWSGDLPAPEWIYFGNSDSKQVLFLVKHDDDEAPDQYWPMEGNMTVFGFGRQYRCCGQYLAETPARFTTGLTQNGSFDTVRRRIESAYRDLAISTGNVEHRPNLAK